MIPGLGPIQKAIILVLAGGEVWLSGEKTLRKERLNVVK